MIPLNRYLGGLYVQVIRSHLANRTSSLVFSVINSYIESNTKKKYDEEREK